MDEWTTEKDNLPCDGAICDVIISDTEKGIGLLCAVIKNGKFMLNNMDITDKVLKWHRLPGVIKDLNGIIQWDK